MRKKTVALYNPYLDVMGGGERHILSILKVISEHDYSPVIYWDTDVSKKISDLLRIIFSKPLEFRQNIFTLNTSDSFSRFKELRNHDIFLYVTDGSYFFSGAKKNFVFCMVPQKSLYNQSLLTKIKTGNYKFISNSKFTASWLCKWGINSQIIYPYIQQEFFQSPVKKEKTILSVGRFFKHLHSKRQDITIEYFNKLQKKDEYFKDYKLILAGNLKQEDQDYFQELQKMAADNKNIIFKTNVTFDELQKLYRSSKYYWHMAGIQIDENKEPQKVEHLGISPIEAMASGAITFAYNAGGLKEIINHGETGFLFFSSEQLIENMRTTEMNTDMRQRIVHNAQLFVKNTFSYDTFQNKVTEVLLT